MIRSALSKVMWVGRATVFLVGVAVTLALVLGVATTALAALPGDPFRLGQTNGIDAMSTLVGNVAGTMLRVDNSSTAAGATALDLQVEAGKPPMKVNSGMKVAKLNSDKIDGVDSTQLAGFGETAYKQSEFLTRCQVKELASKTFSVPRPTRVYASAVASYHKGANGNVGESGGYIILDLLDASNGATLASAGVMQSFVAGDTHTDIPLSLAGVLNSGNDTSGNDIYAAYAASATPFVATPGKQYTLRLRGGTGGLCGTTSPLVSFESIALSYQLIGNN
jgi:hypothetical protein